jgi:hypothetical protein
MTISESRAALSARFSEYYQRQRARLGAAKATVALARKLAVVSFYRWRAAELRQNSPPAVKSSGVHLGWRMVERPTQTV